MRRIFIIGLLVLYSLCAGVYAQDAGVFLPFYFIYDDAVEHAGGGDPNNHTVVYYQNYPLLSETANIAGGKFILNIMRARYFSKFSVAPGNVYKIGVAKGADNYGLNPFDYTVSGNGFDKVDLVLKLGEGGGLIPPAGTVPLDIARNGSNARLTWDNITYPNIVIYKKKGDGTGQFTQGPDGWTILGGYSSGSIDDNNVIAAADKEIYYKAIVQGEPHIRVAEAWAVGKFDLDLVNGFNLASSPMVTLHGNTIDDTFLDSSGGALRTQDTEVYYFNEGSGLMIKAVFNNGAWEYYPNNPYSINLGNAYWVKIPSGTKRLSILGAVIAGTSHRILGQGFSLLGSPMPAYYADLATANLPARGTDEIYLYHASTGLMEKMVNGGTAWANAVPGAPQFGLIPGVGYWYKNNAAEFDWTLNP